MKATTAAYDAERLKWVTMPRLFLRPSFVRRSGDVVEYPFARDLASHDDVDATGTPNLVCVKTISGAAQQTDPISGRSSIGFLEARLTDVSSHSMLRQVADPQRPLQAVVDTTTLTPTCRNSHKFHSGSATAGYGLEIQVDDIRGYPDVGHITIDDEDFLYSGRDLATNMFTGVAPAQRDTGVASHPVGARVHNGEQIRRGTRIAVHLGYAPMTKDQYGPGQGFAKLEVQSIQTQDFNQVYALRCSDIQIFTKRRVFEGASTLNPAVLGPMHPLALFLRVWTSTGDGTNGPYDVLTKELGAAVPYQLIDVAAFEEMGAHPDIINMQFQFEEISSQDAKEWAETQILRPLMILPDVNQRGQYTGHMLTSPTFAGECGWRGPGRGV